MASVSSCLRLQWRQIRDQSGVDLTVRHGVEPDASIGHYTKLYPPEVAFLAGNLRAGPFPRRQHAKSLYPGVAHTFWPRQRQQAAGQSVQPGGIPRRRLRPGYLASSQQHRQAAMQGLLIYQANCARRIPGRRSTVMPRLLLPASDLGTTAQYVPPNSLVPPLENATTPS